MNHNSNSNGTELQADLALILVTLLAAAGWIFSKEALATFEPFSFISLRFASAGLILGLFGWQAILALSVASLRRVLVVGVCFGCSMVFWVLGIYHGTHLGVGAFLNSLGVVMVPLVLGLMGGTLPPTLKVTMPLALMGLACLMLDDSFVFGWGEASFLVAASLFALTFVLNSRAAARTSPLALTAIQLFVVGLLAAPLALLTEGADGIPDFNVSNATVTGATVTDVAAWGWMLAAILIATCVRFFLQTWGQSKTSASAAAVILVAEPVWSAMLAAVWFDETMSVVQMAGCGLIFSALLASRWNAVRQLLKSCF